MAINTTYGLTPQPYEPGMVADARYTQTVSKMADASLSNGQAAVLSGAANHKVKVIAAAADVVVGIVRWEATWMNSADALTTQVHATGDDVSLVTDGPVWVQATVAVKKGDFAYAMVNGSGFTNVATAASTRPVGIFDTQTVGAGRAILMVIPGMTAPAAP